MSRQRRQALLDKVLANGPYFHVFFTPERDVQEEGKLVGVVGVLTGMGIKLGPLFETPSGRYFVAWMGKDNLVSTTSTVDMSKEGYSFRRYSIEEFLDL